jgi:hypothetical protein
MSTVHPHGDPIWGKWGPLTTYYTSRGSIAFIQRRDCAICGAIELREVPVDRSV